MRYVQICLVALATGCGGDAANPFTQDQTDAEGVYRGVTDTGRDWLGIVLGTGDYYILYGAESGGPDEFAGVVHGMARTERGEFASSDAIDFNLEGRGIAPVSVSARYQPGVYMNGAVVYGPEDRSTFTGGAHVPSNEAAADVLVTAGAYSGQTEAPDGGGGQARLQIAPDGYLTGAGGPACDFSARLTPTGNRNVFNFSLHFMRPECGFGERDLDGIVYHDIDTGSLYAIAPASERDGGLFFYGERS